MIAASQVATCLVLGALAGAAGCRFGFDPKLAESADAAPASDAAPLADAVPPTDVAPNTDTLAACTFGPWHQPTNGQPFTAINSPGYDWAGELSDDGLRLIYTTDVDSSRFHLYMAERASRSVPFEPAAPLAINLADRDGEDRDLSFTDTELYYVSGAGNDECIYVSRRVDTPAVWGTPKRLDAVCNGFQPGGIYISRDGQHLYYDRDGVVMMATRTPGGDFDTPGTTVGGLTTSMAYCTLSRDELTIICEAVPNGRRSELWQASRSSIGADFRDAGPVPDVGVVAASDVGDPSLNATGDRLLYATGPLNQTQDLVVVERDCL